MTHLAGFLAISLVVIVTPGPDMALVARNALRGGRRPGTASAAGVVGGLVVWTLAASVGLAALLRASEPAFVALKIAGALYLVFLGLRALRDAIRARARQPLADRSAVRSQESRISFRQGLLSNLGNPKIAVFFTSFLPQFTPAGRPTFLSLLALGLLFCACTLVWLTGYAVAVARAGDVLRRTRVRRLVDAVTGAALVAFGGVLALERRT